MNEKPVLPSREFSQCNFERNICVYLPKFPSHELVPLHLRKSKKITKLNHKSEEPRTLVEEPIS